MKTLEFVVNNEQIVLGIDPGSRRTGYGVIRVKGNKIEYIGSGCIHAGDSSEPLPERLNIIYQGLNQIIEFYNPTCMAVEMTFASLNVQATIKLSEARAIALLVGAQNELNIAEYSPRQIKQAVTSYGAAQKQQVQSMVKSLLKLDSTPQADAADALACAICHGYNLRSNLILGANSSSYTMSTNRGRMSSTRSRRSFRFYGTKRLRDTKQVS